jgi:hypothetical protein
MTWKAGSGYELNHFGPTTLHTSILKLKNLKTVLTVDKYVHADITEGKI